MDTLCYSIHNDKLTHFDAQLACLELDGSLATIDSQEVTDALMNHFNLQTDDFTSIDGLTIGLQKTNWEWVANGKENIDYHTTMLCMS